MGSSYSKEKCAKESNRVTNAPIHLQHYTLQPNPPQYIDKEVILSDDDYRKYSTDFGNMQYQITYACDGDRVEDIECFLKDFAEELHQKKIEFEEQNNDIILCDQRGLGISLAFFMCHRPEYLSITIKGISENGESMKNILFRTLTDTSPPIQTNYETSIRVFHIHTHFDSSCELEGLLMYQALLRFMRESNCEIVNAGAICYVKNGPHDKWNWEIHVSADSYNELGVATTFLAKNHRKGLYHPLHCRTHDTYQKNEFDDHVFRLGWVGDIDPIPLDVNFFKSH